MTLDAAPASVVRQPGLTAVMKGQVYDLDAQGMLTLYRQHGPNFARRFDGAFALVLFDEAQSVVLAVTDRVGSHKLYVAHAGERVTLSTRPDHPEFTGRPYNLAGLASVLVTGSPLNGLTLHEGVQTLSRASSYRVEPGGMVQQPYWEGQMAQGPDTRPEAELREELAELLKRSVRRRVEGLKGPVHLSLSGGHDSRGVLSLLAATGRDLHTFSYTQGSQPARSDTRVADALAAQYGTRHEHIQAYQGDLLATLRRNAAWGHGVTNFCDEVDAWDTLEGQSITDLFTGDQMFEMHAYPLTDLSEQLIKRHIEPFSTLGSLANRLNPGVSPVLESAWTAEVETIRASAARFADPFQQELVLVADQLLPYRLLPWRERYAGRFARIHSPYLDAAVLDFLYRLPPDTLAGKRLFVDTLRELDPALYTVPLARSQGYEADWNAELIKHREAIKEELISGPSRLDAVIPPEAIRGVLDTLTVTADGGRSKLKQQVRQTLGTFRHSEMGRKIFGLAPLKAPPITPATWLLRVLTLRALDGDTGRR
ncbi:asparagine synthase-related protein [Deinococcus aerolatus]|nr:asparagine synthase-related protein [Deinococcus aerolatus]